MSTRLQSLRQNSLLAQIKYSVVLKFENFLSLGQAAKISATLVTASQQLLLRSKRNFRPE